LREFRIGCNNASIEVLSGDHCFIRRWAINGGFSQDGCGKFGKLVAHSFEPDPDCK